jgi:hypothetical protein
MAKSCKLCSKIRTDISRNDEIILVLEFTYIYTAIAVDWETRTEDIFVSKRHFDDTLSMDIAIGEYSSTRDL